MGSSMHNEEDEITGINVTPLVDVMLVLLIIFMVTTTYIVNKSINVTLPKATTGEEGATGKNLAFVLDKDATLFLDGKQITLADLAVIIGQIRKDLSDQKQLQALITADTATPHGAVVQLIDAVRKNGINDFAINVEVESGTSQ